MVLDSGVKHYLLKARNKLRALEGKVLRRLCGHTRQVEDGGCKKLHSDELHTLCSSIILQVVKTKCIEWAGICSIHGKKNICIHNFNRKFLKEKNSLDTYA